MAIVSAAKRDFEIVAQSEALLNFVKERMLDKKFKIRKEAMTGLAFVYKTYISSGQQQQPQAGGSGAAGEGGSNIRSSPPEAIKKAVTWIKNRILHGKTWEIFSIGSASQDLLKFPLGYFMPGMEDRLQVERLINTCLVPFKLEPLDRMKKLYMLFGTIDENACKAFIEVHKNQLGVRKAVAEMVGHQCRF